MGAVAALGVGTALLAGCGSSSSPDASGVVNVLAGENFWGNVVSQIGGSHVKVTSIIDDPNTDPHEYESDDRDAIGVASARLVVENGVGYDDFLSKLLDASPSGDRQVLTVADVLHVTGDDPNPHLWYDTAALPQVASAIADKLAELDPADADAFHTNAQAFDDSLKPILAVIDQIKAKYAGTEIAYTERVPGYLVDAAGLRLGVPVSFTQAVEDGSDPSPKDTAAFDDAVTSRTVKVVLYNAQVTDKQTDQIKQLATSSGVPIVGVTETMPPGASDFQAWQLAQAEQLLAALGGA